MHCACLRPFDSDTPLLSVFQQSHIGAAAQSTIHCSVHIMQAHSASLSPAVWPRVSSADIAPNLGNELSCGCNVAFAHGLLKCRAVIRHRRRERLPASAARSLYDAVAAHSLRKAKRISHHASLTKADQGKLPNHAIRSTLYPNFGQSTARPDFTCAAQESSALPRAWCTQHSSKPLAYSAARVTASARPSSSIRTSRRWMSAIEHHRKCGYNCILCDLR